MVLSAVLSVIAACVCAVVLVRHTRRRTNGHLALVLHAVPLKSGASTTAPFTPPQRQQQPSPRVLYAVPLEGSTADAAAAGRDLAPGVAPSARSVVPLVPAGQGGPLPSHRNYQGYTVASDADATLVYSVPFEGAAPGASEESKVYTTTALSPSPGARVPLTPNCVYMPYNESLEPRIVLLSQNPLYSHAHAPSPLYVVHHANSSI